MIRGRPNIGVSQWGSIESVSRKLWRKELSIHKTLSYETTKRRTTANENMEGAFKRGAYQHIIYPYGLEKADLRISKAI